MRLADPPEGVLRWITRSLPRPFHFAGLRAALECVSGQLSSECIALRSCPEGPRYPSEKSGTRLYEATNRRYQRLARMQALSRVRDVGDI